MILWPGGILTEARVRVLVVDDYEPFRQFISSRLARRLELHVVSMASDGLEAVQKAQELRPDLILLDIGLPSLNGIEAARQIRELSPESKILFVSQESSADVVQVALGTGARGYIIKTDAGNELLEAVSAVLRGELFVGRRLADQITSGSPRDDGAVAPRERQKSETPISHEAAFYSDSRRFLDDLTEFIGGALNAGNAAIVVATELHRGSLLPRLQAYRVDLGAAIEQGRYISLDAAETLSTYMHNGMPNPVRFLKSFDNLIAAATEATNRDQGRVAIFGECVHLLWEQGNVEAAIQVEKLGNQLANKRDADILCSYFTGIVQGGMDSRCFKQIRAEHSAVYFR